MSKDEMGKLLVGVNKWLVDFCKADWKCMEDDDHEWRYTRLAGLVPIDRFSEKFDVPVGTTHIVMVGIEFLSNKITDTILGQEFYVGMKDGIYVILDDIEDEFGGGPSLYDSNLSEAKEWISDMGDDIEVVEFDPMTMEDVAKIMA